MREIVYGLLFGLLSMYIWIEFDIKGQWDELQANNQKSIEKSSGWGKSMADEEKRNQDRVRAPRF